MHRSNGCYGELVVRDAEEPHLALYDFDVYEHQVMISDLLPRMGEDYLPGLRNKFIIIDSL